MAERAAREALARRKMLELQIMAQRICVLILLTDYPRVDIEIEKSKVRERCEELFPDRMELYEMIYESRFDRLWEQFREQEDSGGWRWEEDPESGDEWGLAV